MPGFILPDGSCGCPANSIPAASFESETSCVRRATPGFDNNGCLFFEVPAPGCNLAFKQDVRLDRDPTLVAVPFASAADFRTIPNVIVTDRTFTNTTGCPIDVWGRVDGTFFVSHGTTAFSFQFNYGVQKNGTNFVSSAVVFDQGNTGQPVRNAYHGFDYYYGVLAPGASITYGLYGGYQLLAGSPGPFDALRGISISFRFFGLHICEP